MYNQQNQQERTRTMAVTIGHLGERSRLPFLLPYTGEEAKNVTGSIYYRTAKLT